VPFDGAFSTTHWLIVGLVALLVFPAKDLPVVAQKAGRVLRQLSGYRTMLRSEVRDLVGHLDRAVPGDGASAPAAAGTVVDPGPGALGPTPTGDEQP
jgi:hypothetical protein